MSDVFSRLGADDLCTLLHTSSVCSVNGPGLAGVSYSLSGAGLGAGHDVAASGDDGDAVLLHRGGLHVARLGHVPLQRLTQACLLERLDRGEKR